MPNHKITPVLLEDLLLLWLEKHQSEYNPDETIYFISALCLPVDIKEHLHKLGLEPSDDNPMFYVVPNEYKYYIYLIQRDYGSRVSIIDTDYLHDYALLQNEQRLTAEKTPST